MPVRVAICQPVVPHYRVPVFNLLGREPDIELTILSDTKSGTLQLAEGIEHFQWEHAPIHYRRIGPVQIKNQPAQLEVVTGERFDVAILPWDAHYISAWKALRQRRIPVAMWGHGYSKRPSWWRDRLRYRLGGKADARLLYSRTIAERLIAAEGYDPTRTFVAQNALDQQPISAARQHWLNQPDELLAFQREHDLNPDHTVIFVSRLLAENRVDLMIHALRRVRQELPDAKLILVGDGPDRPRLTELAEQLGQADHVLFTGAIYDEQQLAPHMLSAALFCYPLNIGLSILHAFGYGLPVVTDDNLPAHNPEIEALAPNTNGLLYKAGNIEDMVRTWQRIFTDGDLRKSMSQQALATVTETYTLEHMVAGFGQCLAALRNRSVNR